jgi:hypothetical protein
MKSAGKIAAIATPALKHVTWRHRLFFCQANRAAEMCIQKMGIPHKEYRSPNVNAYRLP